MGEAPTHRVAIDPHPMVDGPGAVGQLAQAAEDVAVPLSLWREPCALRAHGRHETAGGGPGPCRHQPPPQARTEAAGKPAPRGGNHVVPPCLQVPLPWNREKPGSLGTMAHMRTLQTGTGSTKALSVATGARGAPTSNKPPAGQHPAPPPSSLSEPQAGGGGQCESHNCVRGKRQGPDGITPVRRKTGWKPCGSMRSSEGANGAPMSLPCSPAARALSVPHGGRCPQVPWEAAQRLALPWAGP